MERLREEPPGEEAPATVPGAPPGAPPGAAYAQQPYTVIDGRVGGDLNAALSAYWLACSEVKSALLKMHEDKPERYSAAKALKNARYDECKEVFERVLAHIGVHAR